MMEDNRLMDNITYRKVFAVFGIFWRALQKRLPYYRNQRVHFILDLNSAITINYIISVFSLVEPDTVVF